MSYHVKVKKIKAIALYLLNIFGENWNDEFLQPNPPAFTTTQYQYARFYGRIGHYCGYFGICGTGTKMGRCHV